MHRQPLLALLARYLERHPEEQPMVERVRDLVRGHDDCFLRTCHPGHITASAWILSPDRRRFLLGHHRKLDRWLQLGGHADGEHLVEGVALREAREESGLSQFELWRPRDARGDLVPLDVDVHVIPARANEPEHEHHDIRFLLIAAPGQEIRVSDESFALRWFDLGDLERIADEESLLRLGRKAHAAVQQAG